MSTGAMVMGSIVGALAATLAVLVGRNVRGARRVREALERLPTSVRREVLALVERAGIEDGVPAMLLRPAEDDAGSDGTQLFGSPSLPAALPWPPGTQGEPAHFLAQVHLQSPPLPAVWHDRLLLLFWDGEGELPALCVPASAAAPRVRASGEARAAIPLSALPLPRVPAATGAEDERPSPYAPSFLAERIPALRRLLAPHLHGAPEGRLLSTLLVPQIHGYESAEGYVCLMGGEPELIQGEHEARCGVCGGPMRFLVQLGDVLHIPGDVPNVYLYGCDAHPEQVRSFIDMY